MEDGGTLLDTSNKARYDYDTTNLGDIASAVHILFNRAQHCMPVFVGVGRSLRISLVVVAVLAAAASVPIRADMRQQRTSTDAFKRHRWMLMAAGTTATCVMLQGAIADKLYMVDMYKKNKQHFANVFWLRKYVHAVRPPIGLLPS